MTSMKTGTILKASFFAGLIITIIGAYLKITHTAGADIWLLIGLTLSVVFIILAIYEIITSRKVNSLEKILWTIGLVFFNTITGLIYILAGRKRIVDNP
jgi:hypothetical protein